ncbi:MAG: DUF2764 family protein [Bacteroidales bacterium]
MRNYYCLVAGLPDITLDDSKLSYTVDQFAAELKDELSKSDYALVELHFLNRENQNLLNYLRDKEAVFTQPSLFSNDDFDELVRCIKEEEPISERKYPYYLISFLKEYLEEAGKDNAPDFSWEDRLTELYYEYLVTTKNSFYREWVVLNQNVNNILSAISARKHGLEPRHVVVGQNHVARLLSTSGARDFGLSDVLDYYGEIAKLSDESDIVERERKIDLFKWKWLDDNTFFHYFSVEVLLSFLFKLEMTQRWLTLDKQTGEQMFRKIIQDLKQEVELPDEFKK